MKPHDPIFSHDHPKEMYFLALIEMCQRFAYWGVGNLLVLFLVKTFSYSIVQATQAFALFTGISWLLPILGGFVADRWNYHDPLLLAIIATGIGCFLLSFMTHSLVIPALLCIGIGGGLLAPSVYSLLGKIYHNHHHLRDGGFSIYYALTNLGVFLALMILGYLMTIDWKYVFLAAGGVQIIGLIAYLSIQKTLKGLTLTHRFPKKAEDPYKHHMKKHVKDRMILIFIMMFFSLIFWVTYNQMGSSMSLFALKFVDRSIGSWQIPVPWFLAIQTLVLILLGFPMSLLYLTFRNSNWIASPILKTGYSLFFMGICFLIMHFAAENLPRDVHDPLVSPAYLIFAFIFMAIAEIFLIPVGLSLITHLSPHRYTGVLTGTWFACVGVGFYIGGSLAGLIASMKLTSFFLIFVAIAFISAIILIVFHKPLDKLRHRDFL